MDNDFLQKLYINHDNCCKVPSANRVKLFFDDLLGLLFPELSEVTYLEESVFNLDFLKIKDVFYELIYDNPNNERTKAENNTTIFFEAVPVLYEGLTKDAQAMFEGDPAARSIEEVIRTYPGFYAIAAYRVANQLLKQGIEIIPRAITELAHSKTGIDIHPGATIGEYFCIDHGTGIVIGETTIIGNNVKIYQGVTLGALSVNKGDSKVKRHPTIENNVVIYSGATILGGNTIIGEGSIIGGNVWLVKSTAAASKVYYKTHTHD